jgi:Fe(3+) dicitrate transport protein
MKYFLFFVLLVLGADIFAQQIVIKGKVFDNNNHVLIKGAEIESNTGSSRTDSLGQFQITGTVNKPFVFTILHNDYKPFSTSIIVSNDTAIDIFINRKSLTLGELTVIAKKENTFGISRLNNVEGTTIYAGKKSEAVYVQDLNANLAANNSRQIFSKVPGINIFENDGSGVTIGIGGRGLNPNRVSNFNTRQNGYDISADALGYPESYYTPPTEAIDRIEILRGAAGLQFGTQFGGLINYKFTEAPADKKISGNFRQTTAAFGFLNSFNQVAGTADKLSYNTFYQYKQFKGWRAHSELNSHNAFASLKYLFSEKFFIKAEYTFLNYINRQPGGLTDLQFKMNPSLATRDRNWFAVNWNLLAITADYKLSEQTRVNLIGFGLKASREALGLLGRPDRVDDTSTFRNLLSDVYNNSGAELRLLHRYLINDYSCFFLSGVRVYKGLTNRKQGNADKTDLPHFEFLNPNNLENSRYIFPSNNLAWFTENIFQINKKLNMTPGFRFEFINTGAEGYYRLLNKNLAGDTLLDVKVSDNRSSARGIILAGLGAQYKMFNAVEFYANFSQNYRSINFNDMRVVNPNFQVDTELKDERGYTFDAGIRGALKNILYYDAGIFMLSYNNRIGTTLKIDSASYQVIRYRTNIGASRNVGIETFAELDWLKLVNRNSNHKLSTFVNFSFISAVYTGSNSAYTNKKVEYVPEVIFRTGITYAVRKFSFTCQYAYTGLQYSDATNAASSASGIYGIIPSYEIIDISAAYSWKKFGINAGINNLTNASYFTRRTEGFPGPGIIPADPVNGYVTLKFNF